MGSRLIIVALLVFVAIGCGQSTETVADSPKQGTEAVKGTDEPSAGGQLSLNPNYKGK